jgi:hypothetical protein
MYAGAARATWTPSCLWLASARHNDDDNQPCAGNGHTSGVVRFRHRRPGHKPVAAATWPPLSVPSAWCGQERSGHQTARALLCSPIAYRSICSFLAGSLRASSKGLAPWSVVATQSAPADVVVSSPRARYLDSSRVHLRSTRSKYTAGMRLHLCSSHLLRSG